MSEWDAEYDRIDDFDPAEERREDHREPRRTQCDHCLENSVMLLAILWDRREEHWCRSCVNLTED